VGDRWKLCDPVNTCRSVALRDCLGRKNVLYKYVILYFTLLLSTRTAIVGWFKHWPIISIYCGGDAAVVLLLSTRRVVTWKPRLLQATSNQWPEQLETCQLTAYWPHGQPIATSVFGFHFQSFTFNGRHTKRFIMIYDLDRWPWL